MLTVFVFVMNVFSLPGVILICCSEFYFAVTVVGHRRLLTKCEVKIYHFLTESEVITGKSQAEASMY